jgi:hypothetical protein
MFFDQHGGFLEYKINENQKTFAQQTDKVDLITNTPTGIKNPLGQTNKNILTTTSFAAASSTLNINMLNPNDTYLDNKTGKDFIKEQNSEFKSNNFYSSLDIKPIIGKNRITIFEALKTISSDDMNDIKNVFNLVTESAKNVNVVL